MVDSLNQLWIGTSNSVRIEPERNKFKRFDVTDGLLSNHFTNNQLMLLKGPFIYPTYKGFLYSNPGIIKKVALQFQPTSLHLKSAIMKPTQCQ